MWIEADICKDFEWVTFEDPAVLDEDDEDRYMGSDSDFSDDALGWGQ